MNVMPPHPQFQVRGSSCLGWARSRLQDWQRMAWTRLSQPFRCISLSLYLPQSMQVPLPDLLGVELHGKLLLVGVRVAGNESDTATAAGYFTLRRVLPEPVAVRTPNCLNPMVGRGHQPGLTQPMQLCWASPMVVLTPVARTIAKSAPSVSWVLDATPSPSAVAGILMKSPTVPASVIQIPG